MAHRSLTAEPTGHSRLIQHIMMQMPRIALASDVGYFAGEYSN
jgi:uncharacterized PurR-regulated membrane protein YhhQ (DUF165 family)